MPRTKKEQNFWLLIVSLDKKQQTIQLCHCKLKIGSVKNFISIIASVILPALMHATYFKKIIDQWVYIPKITKLLIWQSLQWGCVKKPSSPCNGCKCCSFSNQRLPTACWCRNNNWWTSQESLDCQSLEIRWFLVILVTLDMIYIKNKEEKLVDFIVQK